MLIVILLKVDMLSFIKLKVVMLSVIILKVVMLSVIILKVVMLSVAAPLSAFTFIAKNFVKFQSLIFFCKYRVARFFLLFTTGIELQIPEPQWGGGDNIR
jgi:hypothetical protein